MTDLFNGFTGLNRDDPDFESAGAASRRVRERLGGQAAANEGGSAHVSAPKRSQAPASTSPSAVRASTPTASSEAFTGSSSAGMGAFFSDLPSAKPLGAQRSAPKHARNADMEPQRDARASSDRRLSHSRPLDNQPSDGRFSDGLSDHVDVLEQRWAWAEVDLSAIRFNVAETRRFLSPRCKLMAIVKADAYGHGAVEVSKAAIGAGADWLGVATVPEAVQLRDAGITTPILVLSEPPITSIPLLIAHNVTPAIYSTDFALAYGEAADMRGVKAPYHLAVNTGMNRIGVRYDDVIEFIRQVDFHRALEMQGVFTHFATADGPEEMEFKTQSRRFSEALGDIEAAGFQPGIVHAANSAAIYRYPEVRYDMVRLGISMYGLHPCPETHNLVDLRPAMSVHARIVDTRLVPMSEGVSYGLKYRSPGSVKICTLPIGYADGLRRNLSGAIDFVMGGRYYRQVGEICTDHCMFEVDMRSSARRERVDPQIGDEVLVVGTQGAAAATIEEMAEKLHTNNHEVAIGFGQRLARMYR